MLLKNSRCCESAIESARFSLKNDWHHTDISLSMRLWEQIHHKNWIPVINALNSSCKACSIPGARTTFWGSKCFSRGRRRDFDRFQNAWQAQEFVRVAKTLAGVGDLKRLRNDAFRVAGARISCFAMSMVEASDAETVEGLQISCHGSVTLQWSFRVAVTGLRMPRLNFFVAGAVLSKHALENR